jgi:hypothetical protein
MAERITLTFGAYSRSLDVPDGVTSIIHDAFSDAYNRPETVEDPADAEATIPNPVTKEDFTAKRIRLYVEQILAGYNKKQAVSAVTESTAASTQAILDAVVIDPV